MRGLRLVVSTVLGSVLILTGCTGIYMKEPDQPRTIYSSSDATALVYSDPVQASAVDDHYLRWVAVLLHPVGVILDYAINRPVYRLAAQSPGYYGYTAEDAQLEAQRGSLTTEER